MEQENTSESNNNSSISIRAIIQQDNKDEWISIERGIVIYICFLKGASPKEIQKCVSTVLSSSIVFNEEWKKNATVLETKGDVLIIPQASLAGKMKGKKLQYHSLIDKESGAKLYEQFINEVKDIVSKNSQANENVPSVKHGTYGNRQGLKFESPGPFTHYFEF